MGHWGIGAHSSWGSFRSRYCFCGVWCVGTRRPSYHSCLVCTCCKHCPPGANSDFSKVLGVWVSCPLFLQSVGLWNPCRQCHSRSLFMESDLLQLLLPWRKKQGRVRISPCNLEMLTPVPVSSSVWSLQLWQSSSEVCIAVLVTVSQCLCVWANLACTHLGQSNVLSFLSVRFPSQAPEGESQPMTEVDLFISTQRIKVLNADTQVLAGSHLPRGWSLAWQLGDCALVCRAAVPRCWLPHKLEGGVCSACCWAGGWEGTL